MSIYDRFQGVATRLLTKFDQGGIVYVELGSTGGEPWDPPSGTPVQHPLTATAIGVQAQYVDGSLVVATDKQVTAPVFGVEPTTDGAVTIDGKTHQVVRVDKIPAAGTVVAWRIFVRA